MKRDSSYCATGSTGNFSPLRFENEKTFEIRPNAEGFSNARAAFAGRDAGVAGLRSFFGGEKRPLTRSPNDFGRSGGKNSSDDGLRAETRRAFSSPSNIAERNTGRDAVGSDDAFSPACPSCLVSPFCVFFAASPASRAACSQSRRTLASSTAYSPRPCRNRSPSPRKI